MSRTEAHASAKARLLAWIKFAQPGWSKVYHVGNLSVDRTTFDENGEKVVVEPLNTLAYIAMAACESGFVTLSQRRVFEVDREGIISECFEYSMTRTEQQWKTQ